MKLDILAFGAHPDDVELGAGGILAVHSAAGKKLGIIDLTRGEMGTRGTPELRDEEAKEAGQILGCIIRENLAFSDGKIPTDHESFKLALYTSSATLGATTTAFTTTGQASGTNYTSGGSALTNVTPSATGTTAVTDFNDLTFSTATITARGCMIYNDTNSDKSVATIDFGGDKTSTAGDFTVVFPAKAASTAIIRIA